MEILNKQMTNLINKCCGLNITATLTGSFWMSQNHQQIAFSLFNDDVHDADFCNFVNKEFNCNFAPCTIELLELSILHEVGHFKTFPLFSDNAKAYNQLCKYVIDKIPFNSIGNRLYFKLPIEKKATEWAINFIRTHPNRMKYFERNLNKYVQNFYKRVADSTS